MALPMKKNEIYIEMLSLALPYIRNMQSQGAEIKAQDTSCFFEAELLHNLMPTLLIPDVVEHDIWFLNHQARYYVVNCNADISPNYHQHLNSIKSIFSLVPPELRAALQWQGP